MRPTGLFAPFRLHGTSGRAEAAAALLLVLVLGAAAAWLDASAAWWPWARHVSAAAGVALMLWLATAVRRLHDFGRPGGWALLSLVPLAGILPALAIVFWPPRTRKRVQSGPFTLAGGAVIALIGLGALLRLFVVTAAVGDAAMKPALLPGDVVLVRYADAAGLERGDVVLFRQPGTGERRILRLAGLPGDVVQMRDGRLWLNGAEVAQVPEGSFSEVMAPQGPLRLRPRCLGGPVGDGGICRKDLLRESLASGRAHSVLNIEDGGFGDDTEAVTVPPGALFLLGDNRDASLDSRFAPGAGGAGLVAREGVVGRVRAVLFSAAGGYPGAFWTWRRDRFARGVE